MPGNMMMAARAELLSTGQTMIEVDDSRVFLVMTNQGEALVAQEGGGVFLWDGVRPINKFNLISGGFTFNVAAVVADFMNDGQSQLMVQSTYIEKETR